MPHKEQHRTCCYHPPGPFLTPRWDSIPGSRPTWLIGDNETLWTSGPPKAQRMQRGLKMGGER